MAKKTNNIFTLEMYGLKTEVKLEFESYINNGTLALQLFCKPDEDEMPFIRQNEAFLKDPYQELYGVPTVNLPESEYLDINEQFVDENNMPGIGKWLQKNGIAEPLNEIAFSGFCSYRAYKFNVPNKDLKKILKARQQTHAI